MTRGKIVSITSSPQASPPHWRECLPEKDAELTGDIIEAYRKRRESLKHREKSIARDLAIIQDFLSYVGKPLWHCFEEDFESWCSHLGIERNLAPSSQRHYQTTIRALFQYVVENPRFSAAIQQLYGIRVVQICTSENCIPHIQDRELNTEREALTYDELQKLFDAIHNAAIEAKRFASKEQYPLLRDKAMFFMTYVTGFRLSEVIDMNIDSFSPNPRIPEMGNYGFCRAWRKGSRGSGKKFQNVPLTHPGIPEMMDWYINKVRIVFLMKADPNERALWLSERGDRIGRSALAERLKKCLTYAGLEGRGFTPHCIRHTSVTHEGMQMSLEANRIKHGHAFAATTQGYFHVADEFVDKELASVTRSNIEKIKKVEETKP